MMHIQQQVTSCGCFHDFGTIERRFLQIEGTHKLVLVFCQFLFAHFDDIHLDGSAVISRLDDAVALGREVDAEFGMCLNHAFHDVGQAVGVGIVGIGEQIRDVVDGRGWIFQAVEIDTSLGIGQRCAGLSLLGGRRKMLRLYISAGEQMLEDVVLYRLDGAGLHQAAGVECHAIALVDLDGQLDGRDGRQSGIAQHRRHAKFGVVDDVGYDLVQLLLQHVHGHVGLLDGGSFLLGFGQGALVHLLVLVQRDAVDLHRHGRHHVRRLLVQNEVVEGLNVHLLVAHDVGSDELAAALLVKGLYRGILDAGELADDTLDLLELDAETANLYLAVAASHKLDVARGQVTNYVARAINAGKFFLGSERVGDVDLGRLFRTIQVAAAHLGACCPQLACCPHRQTVTLRVNDIQAHVFRRFANGYLLHFLVYKIVGNEDRCLGGTINVVELDALRGRE